MKDLFGHDKVEDSIERLKMFEPPEGYFGATSYGKDSITLMELCKIAQVKVDWHYSVTTIDPPELIYFGRKYHPDVIWERPEIPFLKMLVKRGFHLRQNRWCCTEYKERGGSGRKVLTGIRWEESVKNMGTDGATHFIEVGPGKVLQGLIKRIQAQAQIFGVDKEQDINGLQII